MLLAAVAIAAVLPIAHCPLPAPVLPLCNLESPLTPFIFINIMERHI
jgi:hypothetical protein